MRATTIQTTTTRASANFKVSTRRPSSKRSAAASNCTAQKGLRKCSFRDDDISKTSSSSREEGLMATTKTTTKTRKARFVPKASSSSAVTSPSAKSSLVGVCLERREFESSGDVGRFRFIRLFRRSETGWGGPASLEFAVYFLSHGRWFSFVSVTGRCVGVSWIDHGGGDEDVDLRASVSAR